MKKSEIIIKILYTLSALGYITYLVTQKSAYMFCGGLLMITASLLLLIYNKKEK